MSYVKWIGSKIRKKYMANNETPRKELAVFKRNPIKAKVDEQIINLLESMELENGYTDNYKSMATHAEKLLELRQKDTVSKDAWVTVGTHIAGLIVLMNHERAHVIASKALGFVKKIV